MDFSKSKINFKLINHNYTTSAFINFYINEEKDDHAWLTKSGKKEQSFSMEQNSISWSKLPTSILHTIMDLKRVEGNTGNQPMASPKRYWQQS